MIVETIILSEHAIERFRERARPALTAEAAEEELARLVLTGAIVTQPPAWLAARAKRTAPLYLVIADLVLPLVPAHVAGEHVATTCLAKGSMSDATRERRNMRRRRRVRHRALAC